ncbi:uncharacterized protein A1O5_09901 [Cladophialophora psammophila CBS 110553]|uniref:2-deoxy-D-gluconate 3-dehydrogenase n=1 Tax=Cladophialophora psammophila CBS 110553 TaxID=1182543 RepID=W9XA00_9EURO|nr:uncharacterized protein A1O5_09901 [Cladophialophora psammophila CBS 110553]EXJ67254.1 hypothetical protein A1O5_09901 [Cladophialophora psammophila CBS 110553]
MATTPAQYLTSMFSLEGQIAIMTGATGGLGSALAGALAQAGVSNIISIEAPNDPLSSNLKTAVEEVGGKVTAFHCDLRNAKNLRECYQSIWKTGVEPDILINVAGVMRRNLCEDATDDEIDLLFEVNAKAVYISMQEVGRKFMAHSKGGKIINIASVTSYQAGFNTSVYSSTKGAVLQMTKAFSNEWASKGIQVNCIAPGFMRTAMTAQYQDNPKMIEYLMSRVPAQRWGEPRDLVPAMLFLAAPSNTFTSGACLIVDGGYCGK